MTAANTAAMTADNTCQAWTTVEYRPSAQTALDTLDDVPTPTDLMVHGPRDGPTTALER
jgi:hypothetical protein